MPGEFVTDVTVRFALEGLTCGACVATVRDAVVQQLGPRGVNADTVHVTLLPEATLTLDYDSKQVAKDDILEAVEAVGFGAELLVSTSKNLSPELPLIVTAKFSLEGLTCGACVSTVREAITKEFEAQGLLPETVSVTLLPAQALVLEYDPDRIASDQIVEVVEDVGFGATFLHATPKEVGGDASTRGMRTVCIEVGQNVDAVCEYLQNQDFVVSAELAITKSTRKRSRRKSKWGRNPLTSFYTRLSQGITKSKWEMNPSTSFGANKEESTDVVLGGSLRSKELSSGPGTVRVSFREGIIGVRTLVESIEAHSNIVALGGVQSFSVQAANSYLNDQRLSEERRRTEICAWRDAFLFSAVFAIPVFLVSMVFVYIPKPKEFFHSIAFAGVTYEELFAWVLATPVQFISGGRFYRDSYYNIKTRHLSMSFLIALGTSAAYLYSCFVVVYNAQQYLDHGKEIRLMQAFESSALLIMFVILGKFLEAKAKARTSRAISNLAQLTPEEAALVGVVSQGDDDEDKSEKEEARVERKIPLSLLQLHDILLVRPGEKIPSDGVVWSGTSVLIVD